jgi:hypothetical protein
MAEEFSFSFFWLARPARRAAGLHPYTYIWRRELKTDRLFERFFPLAM